MPITSDGHAETAAAGPDDALTALLHAQSQLDALRRQLGDSHRAVADTQRLATIGTIAAVIAHEFNNLLTPTVSYCQYALTSANSDTPDMELVRKALSKSFASAEKAGKICGSMLALARGDSSFGEISVQTLVDETLNVLARDPRKDGIALRIQVQPNLFVRGDLVQLEQVLLNLLINARHAMLGRRGGSLTIKASQTDGDARVKLQVIDTGPGIPADHIEKIFDPFFTTKRATRAGEPKGSGLGLAICKEIVEHHGGEIAVESTPGKGTTFTIHLPAAELAKQVRPLSRAA